MKAKLLFLYLIIPLAIMANELPMGGWQTHFAYNNITQITQSEEKVYAISNGSLFSVGKYDYQLSTYSKIFGLSDSDIASIGYSEKQEVLVVAYSNANIDLITSTNSIYNITDILRKAISGSKQINQMFFKENSVYLSCDFGIVIINLRKKEIQDTYIIGPNATHVSVKSFTEYGNHFYALTPTAIYRAVSTGSNLANYQNWSTITLPAQASELRQMVSCNNKLYILDSQGDVYTLQNEQWSNPIYSNIKQISSNDNVLFLTYANRIAVELNAQTESYTLNNPGMGIYDSQERALWLVSATDGLYYYNLSDQTFNTFKLEGTAANSAWRIRHSQGRIYAVPGGRWASQNLTPGAVMIYENGKWFNIETQSIADQTGFPCTDFVDILPHPHNKTHFFVASYGGGLYEFRDDRLIRHYNAANSNIETLFPNSSDPTEYYLYNRVDGLCFDKLGNLWFLNPRENLIKYLNSEGVVVPFGYNSLRNAQTSQDIIIDKRNANLKWVLIPRNENTNSTALFVFNDNGTLNDPSDDQTRMFSSFYDQDGNQLNPANFRCMAQDNNGVMWLGTSTGPIVLENSSRLFTNEYRATRIKIPRNDGTNLADYLLESEQINAIAIDGGNRKWIGTETSGVFLISEDGLETIHHFRTDNSPLLSNTIQSIGINDATGEVFFGTANGLISYQADATEAKEKFQNVHAFPNPVRPDYHGTITITGLMDESIVKITDINANVVYETRSNGGTATWDGTRKGGKRVATGVYLVMCFSKDGKQKATTKILFIN